MFAIILLEFEFDFLGLLQKIDFEVKFLEWDLDLLIGGLTDAEASQESFSRCSRS